MSRRPFIIAGPCSAESEEQILATARGLSDVGIDIFRAGLWKPRTHPGGFEGVGAEGLAWLLRVRKETGLRVATEVASARHVEDVLAAGLDAVWLGARTTASPFLVQEIADALAGSSVEVFVKNPVSPDIGLWSGAVERLTRAGITRIALIHRGFTSPEHPVWRNDPVWRLAIEMRTMFPSLPLLVDPSHMGGDRAFLQEISQKALDLGFDGLMIESHCCPAEALSDARQQIAPSELGELLSRLSARSADTDDADFNDSITRLRARIDVIDDDILRLLATRLGISREIGLAKRSHSVAIVQASRWDSVLTAMLERGAALGIPADTIRTIFTAIHAASVKAQE